MRNMKCYGRKQIVVPKEKSFITKFFDGNESSDIFSDILEDNNERVNDKEDKENIFDSPNLFNEVLPPAQKKNYGVRSVAEPNNEDQGVNYENKENMCTNFQSPALYGNFSMEQKEGFGVQNVRKLKHTTKNRIRKNNYVRKKKKGIQHLNTKYCKSQQPNWNEFEEHEFNIEKQEKHRPRAVIEEQISKIFKNHNRCAQNVPCPSIQNNGNGRSNQAAALSHETPISPKRMKTVASKLDFSSQETLESSSELFMENFKPKKSSRNKTIKSKKISSRKKQSSKLSHNIATTLEQKINQCMQNVDFSESCNKNNSNSKIFECKEKTSNAVDVLYDDSGLEETVPIPCSSTILLGSQNPQQKLSTIINDCPVVHSRSNNFPSCKSTELSKDTNLIPNMSKNASLYKNQQEADFDKSQKLTESLTIPYPGLSNASCRLTTKNISDKTVCITENEPNYIKPKLFEKRKINNSNISSSKNVNSLNMAQEILKKSIFRKGGSNVLAVSPNMSNIAPTSKSFGIKFKGKFATSTPVTNKKRIHNFDAAEKIVLSDNESMSHSEIYSKQSASFCQKFKENKHLKNIGTETLTNSFINFPNKSASIEILKSLHCPITPNLHISRTSLDKPKKSEIPPVSHKKTQSLLNISSTNPSSEREKSDSFSKAKLLKLCDQDSVTPFSNVYDWKNFNVKKIGEGTYGEVFMLSKGKQSTVLKVIAVSEDPNVKNLQGLSSVYSEVKISKSLSELRSNKINQSKNFVKVIRSSVVCGLYPSVLMEAWDDFSQDRSTYNDRPDIYSSDQLFVILELEYGGKDMSCFTLRNAVEAEVILKQIAVSLAIAEDEFSFEHRDLHLGNILVKRNRSKTVSYKIRGKDVSFKCLGLQVTIIDFTLSLLSDQGYIYYYDLAEDSLFDQTGDYQFDVYKSMRRHLENKWEECSLYSNILWLKYLCKKLKEFKYTHPTAVTHKRGLKAIDSFNIQLMKCSCALECLEKCGITKSAFKRSISDTPRRSILVSRNSIQKSKLSICN